MPLHPQVVQLMNDRASTDEPLAYELPIEEARRQAERETATGDGQPEPVGAVTDLVVSGHHGPDIPVRWYEPHRADHDTPSADERSMPSAPCALAWELALGDHVIPIPGARRVESILDSIRAVQLSLTAEDLAQLDVPCAASEDDVLPPGVL